MAQTAKIALGLAFSLLLTYACVDLWAGLEVVEHSGRRLEPSGQLQDAMTSPLPSDVDGSQINVTALASPPPFGSPPPPLPALMELAVGSLRGSGAGQCGAVEENVDYRGGDLSVLQGVRTAAVCSAACGAEPACESYTFAVAQDACYLKRQVRPNRVRSDCCISGLKPCAGSTTPTMMPVPVYNYSSQPIRGVAYGPLPCKDRCWVSEDMLQEGYQPLWGPAPGRNDLGVIKELGANTVRLYHSIGLDGPGNHGLFLDYAETLGLDVMPGYHTYNAIYGGCPHFDCYATWKRYTLQAFEQGFQRGGAWHPAVSVLLLFNELDFFRAHGPTAHLRSAISALDGVLAAEREAGVAPGRVKISIAWSNAPGTSLDGQVSGFAIWAFQDVAAGIMNPWMVGYTPRTPQASMVEAYRTRWAHSINVQTPGIVGYMKEHYERFEPTPWFIGEYGANGLSREAIQNELAAMDESAQDKTNPFMGMAFFQFQTAYFKGGSEMNFGLFRLGDRQVAETGNICDKGISCRKWPVYCLTTSRGALPEIVQWRATAVATAWGGLINSSHMC
jgi:hypothetical protein